MSIKDETEPLKIGTIVRIRDSGYGRATIVEFRGPLGPTGTRVYRIQVGKRQYIEVLEDQLIPEPAE